MSPSSITIPEPPKLDQKYLSKRTYALKPSGIRKFFDIAATMDDVISLGVGEPDFTTPSPVIEAAVDSLMKGETHYTANAGIIELRRALADHLQKRYNVTYNPATEMVLTVGGSEALYLAAVAILNPGDKVIIPTPCFVAYQAEVALAGGVCVEIPCRFENNFSPDPAEIEAAITPRTRALLIGYPCNPTGAVASRETLLAIAALAEKHDLIVISDEIYDRLVYGVEHVCFAALPGMQKRTIFLGGFSKDYAMTGWRIGYAAAPVGILQGMLRVHQYTIMSAPTMAQRAAIEAIQNGETYVQQMVKEYDRRRKLMVRRLNEMGLPTFEPKGAFYAFPKVDGTGLTSDEFATRLLEEEMVAVIPGEAFGAGGEGYVRCCYATAYEKIEEAMDRMERFVKRL
jgi:aminotransferase